MKIAVTRLRSRIKWENNLSHTTGLYCLNRFIKEHKEFDWCFYNITFDGTTPKRNPNEVKDADVHLIPSENEFLSWIPGFLHTKQLAKTNEQIDLLKPNLVDRKIIILQWDRADSIDLFRNYTFGDVTGVKYEALDEDDFPMGLSVLSSYFLESQPRKPNLFSKTEPAYDFIYWGTDKSKLPGGAKSTDERGRVFAEIRKREDLKTLFVGRFSKFQRDLPIVSMDKLNDFLNDGRATLCFNWMSDVAITARYHEAMSSDSIIPLLWKGYDSTNRLQSIDWQRCHSVDDVVEKLMFLRTAEGQDLAQSLKENYRSIRPTIEETYELYEKLMLQKIHS